MDLAVQRVFSKDRPTWQEPAIQAEAMENGGYTITNELAERPTPRRLDALLARYPTFQLHQGGRIGYTVLQIAIEANALPLIRHILNMGPDLVDTYWHEQQLPQIFSATKSWAIFSEFIKRGANIHARSRCGGTALEATSFDAPDISVIRYLLRHGAVINELGRQEILHSNSFSNSCKNLARTQPALIRHGLEQILGEDLFLQGHFPLLITKEATIPLPPEIRTLIWRFMTNCWDAPAIKNCIIFPIISEKEARKMLLIEKLATKKIERLCGELATFSTKVEDAIAKLSKPE